MKKIFILSALSALGLSKAQVRTNGVVSENVLTNSTAFLDASSSPTWNGANNLGKGLIFPRTDLTALTTISSVGSGGVANYPTRMDGMVVYNVGSGSAGIGTTSVTPGFYYYENKTTNINGGTWKPFTSAALATGANNGNFWAINGNSAVPVDQAKIGTTDNVPVQMISNGATFQTYGVSNSDASFRKVVINPNGSVNTTMAKSKTVGGAGFDFALEVAGKSWFENGIVTSNSTYPDYVFDKYFTGKSKENARYSFLTLAETEKYIKENNHLPGVTAIGDLAKGGSGYMIDATQLSVQSLEKIEELYLHMIEQQKQIELLQKEIEVLKASSRK